MTTITLNVNTGYTYTSYKLQQELLKKCYNHGQLGTNYRDSATPESSRMVQITLQNQKPPKQKNLNSKITFTRTSLSKNVKIN